MQQSVIDPSVMEQPVAEGIWYILPKRKYPELRMLAVGGVMMGLLGTVFMCFWMGGPLTGGVAALLAGSSAGWMMIGFGLLGVFGFIPSVTILACSLGVMLHQTHGRIGLLNGKLVTREYVGPFWRSWSVQVEDVESIRARMGSEDAGGACSPSGGVMARLSGLAMVTVSRAGKKRGMPVVIGYPIGLTKRLLPRVEQHVNYTSGDRLEPRTEAVEVTWSDDEDVRDIPKPVDTAILVEQRPGGLHIEVPPKGLLRGSKGLLGFAIFWNLFIALFFGVGFRQVVASGEWLVLLFMLPFVAVGVGMLLGAIHMGRKRAGIEFSAGQLTLVTSGLWGTKSFSWRREQIEAILMGASGMEVNDRPVMELQVILKDEKHKGCLRQLTNDELAWLADVLTRALFGAPE